MISEHPLFAQLMAEFAHAFAFHFVILLVILAVPRPY